VYIEKIRPIDKQLSYQIDKLLRATAKAQASADVDATVAGQQQQQQNGAAAASGGDALQFRSNPQALIAKMPLVGDTAGGSGRDFDGGIVVVTPSRQGSGIAACCSGNALIVLAASGCFKDAYVMPHLMPFSTTTHQLTCTPPKPSCPPPPTPTPSHPPGLGAGPTDGVYQPPKLNPVAMPEDRALSNKEMRRIREAQRRAQRR
jgi:hypothetical protein